MSPLHRMECDEPWFSLLRNGTKPLTGRKNTLKYQSIRPGDSIELFCGKESFRAKVTDIKKFASVEEYFQTVSLEKALPGIKTLQEGLKIYHTWNSPDEIRQWGFIAIYIQI